jgi:hypothetical protein
MKRELRNTGFMSGGSSAPPDVVRELFTAKNLAGDITNDNSSSLLESYLTDS